MVHLSCRAVNKDRSFTFMAVRKDNMFSVRKVVCAYDIDHVGNNEIFFFYSFIETYIVMALGKRAVDKTEISQNMASAFSAASCFFVHCSLLLQNWLQL